MHNKMDVPKKSKRLRIWNGGSSSLVVDTESCSRSICPGLNVPSDHHT